MTRPVLHEDPVSGNCYKIRLTAALLGIEIDRHRYDILRGETRTAAFLTNVNANGRIPVLQIGGRFLPESNAACFYLADDSHLVPTDRFDRADMLHWMFFEQYQHEPNIATLRFWLKYVGVDALGPERSALVPSKRAGGEAALDLMDAHLRSRDWFVGNAPTLADVALYAYTHVADEAGFDLSGRDGITRWMDRIAALPGYIPMAD